MFENIDFSDSEFSNVSNVFFLTNEEIKILNNNDKEIKEGIKKKRGRKTGVGTKRKYKRKTHVKTDDDNILIKIQVHFINFIINISNDAIKTALKKGLKLCFKYINYKDKKTIIYEQFEQLKKSPIKEILKKPISKKYKNFLEIENYNERIYNKVINKSEWLKEFYEIKYIDLFKLYYNNTEQMNNIIFNGQIINFSKKTKSLFNLIQKNKDLKDYIINIIDTYYFNNIETNININMNKNNYFQVKKVKKK